MHLLSLASKSAILNFCLLTSYVAAYLLVSTSFFYRPNFLAPIAGSDAVLTTPYLWATMLGTGAALVFGAVVMTLYVKWSSEAFSHDEVPYTRNLNGFFIAAFCFAQAPFSLVLHLCCYPWPSLDAVFIVRVTLLGVIGLYGVFAMYRTFYVWHAYSETKAIPQGHDCHTITGTLCAGHGLVWHKGKDTTRCDYKAHGLQEKSIFFGLQYPYSFVPVSMTSNMLIVPSPESDI